MTPQETVQEFVRALEAMDIDRALSLADPNIVYENVGLPPIRGMRAFTKTLRMMEQRFTGFEVVMHRIAANGPAVLTERTDILHFLGFRLEIWVCGTFEVHDGKITLWKDYFDWAQLTGRLVKGIPGALVKNALRAIGRG
ncbi:MAG: limonene-1,2-epoxide hydrolase family protein [Polyangiales bacterium]